MTSQAGLRVESREGWGEVGVGDLRVTTHHLRRGLTDRAHPSNRILWAPGMSRRLWECPILTLRQTVPAGANEDMVGFEEVIGDVEGLLAPRPGGAAAHH